MRVARETARYTRYGIIALADDQGFRDKFRAGLVRGAQYGSFVDNDLNVDENVGTNAKDPLPDKEMTDDQSSSSVLDCS